MNEAKIAQLKTSNGVIELDANKPFAVVLPTNSNPRFVNANGEVVDAM